LDRRQTESAIAGIVRLLGTSLKNRGLYPPSHPLVRTPIEKCFAELGPLFADRTELALTVADGTLDLEGSRSSTCILPRACSSRWVRQLRGAGRHIRAGLAPEASSGSCCSCTRPKSGAGRRAIKTVLRRPASVTSGDATDEERTNSPRRGRSTATPHVVVQGVEGRAQRQGYSTALAATAP
jgi:hypothetical protein